MLTRLSDRIDCKPDGGEIRVVRYGMWGAMSEIERRGRKWFVVHQNKKEKEFKSLAEAEIYLTEIVRKGGK